MSFPRWFFWLGALACMLPACSRFTAEPYTTSTDAAALMHLVLPRWAPQGAASVVTRPVPGADASAPVQSETRILEPVLVFRLSPGELLMIVAGAPASADGVPQADADTPARLDAYWFIRRGNRWYLSARQPDFALAGFSGQPGRVGTVALSRHDLALYVENSTCRNGRCGDWLNLYAIGSGTLSPLLPDATPLQTGASTDRADAECQALLGLRTGSRQRVAQADFPAHGCYAIPAHWHVDDSGDKPGILQITQQGKRVVSRRVEVESEEAAIDARIRAAIEAGEDCCTPEPPRQEYLANITAVGAQLDYLLVDGRYAPLHGRSVLPPW